MCFRVYVCAKGANDELLCKEFMWFVSWCLHQASLEIYSLLTAAHSLRNAGVNTVEKHKCADTYCKLLNENTNTNY